MSFVVLIKPASKFSRVLSRPRSPVAFRLRSRRRCSLALEEQLASPRINHPQWPTKNCLYIICGLVVSTPLKNYESLGMIIPNMWKNKTWSKPPTSKWLVYKWLVGNGFQINGVPIISKTWIINMNNSSMWLIPCRFMAWVYRSFKLPFEEGKKGRVCMYVYMYIYIYICMCVCVCVYVNV